MPAASRAVYPRFLGFSVGPHRQSAKGPRSVRE